MQCIGTFFERPRQPVPPMGFWTRLHRGIVSFFVLTTPPPPHPSLVKPPISLTIWCGFWSLSLLCRTPFLIKLKWLPVLKKRLCGQLHSQSLSKIELIPSQTPFSAKRAGLSNGVYCYAILFKDGQDKRFLFVVVHMFASFVYIAQ